MSTKTNKLNDAAYDLADLLNSEQLDYSGGLRNFIGQGGARRWRYCKCRWQCYFCR